MNREKEKYLEEIGLLFDQMGMTRMSGRAFGYLIVCDEEHVSFEQIRQALQASKGSISMTMKQLLHTGFVETMGLPGDRKTYYRISGVEIGKMLQSRMQFMDKFSNALMKGKALKDKQDKVSRWLEETSVFYDWVEHKMSETIAEWEEKKEMIMKKKKKAENEKRKK